MIESLHRAEADLAQRDGTTTQNWTWGHEHVGLLSEEYDPHAKRLVGNFPQAFSHLALINTAYNISKASKPAEQRSEHRAQSGG